MIEHDSFLFLAAKDLSTALGPAEVGELETHLAGCAACQANAAGFQRDHQALVRSLSEVPVPPQVRAAVVRAAAGHQRSSGLTLLVAAALLIVGLLALVAFAGSPRPAPVVDLNGGWYESPNDGVGTTITISGFGPTRLVEFLDLSGARCGGDESRGAGSGSVGPANEVRGEFSRVQCQDGTNLVPFPFRYTYDEGSGLLGDQDGVTYRRVVTSSPLPTTFPTVGPTPSRFAPTPSADLDVVSGTYTYTMSGDLPGRSASVEARGSDPVTGTWTFQALPDGAVQTGPVTCLLVLGSEAFLYGPSAEEGGRGAFLWVIDGGAADTDRATTWMQDLPTDPLPPDIEPQTLDEMEGWCRNAGEGFPGREDPGVVPLLSGSLSVHAAQ